MGFFLLNLCFKKVAFNKYVCLITKNIKVLLIADFHGLLKNQFDHFINNKNKQYWEKNMLFPKKKGIH